MSARRKPVCGLTAEQHPTGRCKECTRVRAGAWREANPDAIAAARVTSYATTGDRIRAKATSYYHRNKTKVASRNLRNKYGIGIEEYDRKLEEQQGGCAICGLPAGEIRLAVDHNRSTGQVRDLLCSAHNLGIGLFDHNPELLQRAVEYMERHNRRWAERTA